MSHDDDFELFQQMMGDVKPITQDTAEHKKVHQVTDAHLAKREAAIWLTEDDPEYLSRTCRNAQARRLCRVQT